METTLNCQDLKGQDLTQAISICQGFSTVKLALNFNPAANHVTRNHCLVLIEAPAGCISKLQEAGFSLTLRNFGLIVSKY